MHTAEHLLNAAMVRMFGCSRAFSSHIERKKSKCDYRFGRDLTDEEKAGLEKAVNDAIASATPVTEELMPRAEAETKFDLGRLPDEARGGELRIVRIGDYDACPCIGPHAASTAEIGVFRLVSTGFADGILRIRFKLQRPE